MHAARITGSVLLALTSALFFWMALTVPAFAATAPAVIAIFLATVAWFVWPKKKKVAA